MVTQWLAIAGSAVCNKEIDYFEMGWFALLKANKTSLCFLFPVAVLLAIAFGLREIYENSDSAMVQAVMSTCRNMIHI